MVAEDARRLATHSMVGLVNSLFLRLPGRWVTDIEFELQAFSASRDTRSAFASGHVALGAQVGT